MAAKMNVWALKDHTKLNLLDVVLKKDDLKKASCIIVLDLSLPWTIE